MRFKIISASSLLGFVIIALASPVAQEAADIAPPADTAATAGSQPSDPVPTGTVSPGEYYPPDQEVSLIDPKLDVNVVYGIVLPLLAIPPSSDPEPIPTSVPEDEPPQLKAHHHHHHSHPDEDFYAPSDIDPI
ncbi:hypothetical protein BJ508DRAFT_314667 [Ascobolus immersus RN42]|uniref:Uncharacterized protein n=1 Tax=Ascobolus immersus RN42 TaxID=1160509 RepID=A0A3N4HE78_ASCIM|nr:hypothetical protein BJ508DRAFT_314667 [Ascobolus immersus RN42]